MKDFQKTYEFLNLFRDENEPIYICLLHENPQIENKSKFTGVHHLKVPLNQLNRPLNQWSLKGYSTRFFVNYHNQHLGKAVYFIPNAGGTKNKEINSIRAWFIDVDFAKIKEVFLDKKEAQQRLNKLKASHHYQTLKIEKNSKNTKYILRGLYSEKKINQFKKDFFKKHQHHLSDSTIVETYSGFHVYWLAEKTVILDDFQTLQDLLIHQFNADPQVKKLANLMRVPGFVHQKYKKPFLIKIIQLSKKRFTAKELKKQLNLKSKDQIKGYISKTVHEKLSFKSPLTRPITYKRKRKKSDIIFRKPTLSDIETEMNFQEALKKVVSEPLMTFIESPVMKEREALLCPFHDDEAPSAMVYESSREEEVFYCFACHVGTRNIIGLHQLHFGKSQRETVKELGKIIGITIIETAYEKRQLKKYQNNREYLEKHLNTLLPATSKWINQYQRNRYLDFFNRLGKESITNEHYQYKEQNVFFASYRHIAKELKKENMQSVQNTMILLNLLGFIERVPESDIPATLKERAEEERQLLINVFEKQWEEGKQRAKAIRLINFYIVHDWKQGADK